MGGAPVIADCALRGPYVRWHGVKLISLARDDVRIRRGVGDCGNNNCQDLSKGVGAAIYSPDEARYKMNLGPVKGGGTPYLQQQNYSLEALARRDENPAPSDTVPAPVARPQEPVDDPEDDMKSADRLWALVQKEMGPVHVS